MNAPNTLTQLAAWHVQEAIYYGPIWKFNDEVIWSGEYRFHLRAALLIITAGGSRRVRAEAKDMLAKLA